MKYLFALVTLFIGLSSMAQSKKEQIATLTTRLDSLNKEYVKDTTYLSNTVETIDRKYTIMSAKYDEVQDLIKKKSATITDKSNTIKALNARNMDLMAERKETQKKLNEFKFSFKDYKDSLENDMFLFSLSNGARPIYDGGKKLPVAVEVGLYINGRFYIIDTFDDVGYNEDEEAQLYKHKKGIKYTTNIGLAPDHLGWKDIGIELIENRPYIIDTDGGGDSQTVRMRKIVFDPNHNMDLIQIFNANISFGGDGIDCISGDCDYKGYLSNKYPDDY